MKTLNFLATTALIVLLTGCALLQTPTNAPTLNSTDMQTPPTNTAMPPTEAPTVVPPVTLDLFKNMIILAPEIQKNVQLVDGKFTENLADGSTQLVFLDEHAAFGDINGDGIDDVALLIVESTGGTGSFVSLTAMISTNGGYVQTNSISIDDRPIIHSLDIGNGEIVLNANVHGINDPMVDPTVNMTKSFRLFNDQLSLWRQTILMSDGVVRAINIDTPIENAEVSGNVTITGSMPIAAFENTLQLQVFTAGGSAIPTSAFMVTAEDMGKPATFNNTLSIGAYPSGTLIKIQLAEVSMADGSPMLIDSVLVKVK